MKIITTLLTTLLLTLGFSNVASAEGKGHHHDHGNLEHRMDSWVKEVCGDDAACAEEKRAHYKQRMTQYKQRVQKMCGDDEACRQEMRAKYMERRAKREARINTHCGDDQACRTKLRDEYRQTMDKARKKCGEDKACWEDFYKEKKPK